MSGPLFLRYFGSAGTYTPTGGGGGSGSQADTYAASVLSFSPVAYWKMNETSGTTMTDSSGNGLHGTYYNSPTLGATGPFTGATGVTFAAASSQYALVGDNALLDIGTSDFTLSWWFYMSAAWPAAYQYVIAKRGGGDGLDYEIRLEAGSDDLVDGRFDNTLLTSGNATNVNDSAWHFMALSIDRDSATGGKWYLDGVTWGTDDDFSAKAAVDISNAYPLYIARRAAGNYFDGRLSQVAFFASALSAANIATLRTAAGF